MLAYRYWRVFWKPGNAEGDVGHPALYSVVYETPWHSAVMSSNRAPGADDGYGIYSYSPESEYDWLTDAVMGLTIAVVGAVDAHGVVRVHEDGTVRSQHARILALRLRRPARCDHATAFVFDRDLPALSADDRRVIYCACQHTPRVPERHHELAFDELEELLLQHYGVPRLPEGVGPWHAGVGA